MSFRVPSMRLHASSMLDLPQLPYVPQSIAPTTRLFVVGGIVAMSGLLYGLDTGSIGPLTEMASFSETIGQELSPSLHGFFVASILLSASISSLCSGHVADRISRRYGVALGALIFALGAFISAISSSLPALIVARLITGIGAGQTVSVGSIHLVEIATAQVRGKLVCMVALNITTGIMIGYFITYGSQNIASSLSWRLPFIIQSVCALVLSALIMLFVPFSPRWQLQQGREADAVRTLETLRLSKFSPTNEALRTLQYNGLQLELVDMRAAVARQDVRQRVSSYSELFHKPYRKRFMLGIAMMSFQQLSGIDVILYFAPIVFSSIFSSQTASFLASGVSGIVLTVFTLPAQIYVDKWGRKPMMVIGGTVMGTCFLIIGSMFAAFGSVDKSSGQVLLRDSAARWIVVLLIYAFVGTFSMTWAVVCRIYSAEIVPTRLRSKAAALHQLANWTTNFIVALSAPSFLRASPSGPYFFFAGCLALSTAMCATLMRETKNRTLEQIDLSFGTQRAS